MDFLTEKNKTERKNYNEKKLQIWFTQTLIFKMVICIFCLFQFLKNLLNAKEKEKKENLGKDLVEIFAALLMLKNSEFCRRPRTKSTLLLMLLLKKIW
mgnify:CR=1 FL=1